MLIPKCIPVSCLSSSFLLHAQKKRSKEKGTPMFFLTADCCVLWLISRTRFAQTPGNLNANLPDGRQAPCNLPKKHNGEFNEQEVKKPVSINLFYCYHNTLGHSLFMKYKCRISVEFCVWVLPRIPW